MRPRTLLALVAAVLALGAFIWFYERELPSTEERQERAKKVLPLDLEEVKEVEVAWEGQRVRLVRRVEGRAGGEGEEEISSLGGRQPEWDLVEPLAARADRFAVEGLIRSIADLEKERTLEEARRGDYELEPPRATATLVTDDGDRILEVGIELPAGNSRVVAVAGEPELFVVAGGFFEELTKDPGDWRSKDVFEGLRDDVQRVSLETPGQKVLLGRRGEEFWIEAPLTDRADSEHVNVLLSDLTSMRVDKFLDEPEISAREMGLDPPGGVVEAVIDDQAEVFRLVWGSAIGEEGDRWYARVGEQVFETTTDLGETFGRSPEEWRSRAWASLKSYEIDRVEVEGGEGAVKLERSGSDWLRDGQEKISYSTVSDFLYEVTSARAERVLAAVEVTDLSLGDPVLTIRFATDEGRQEDLLLYAAGREGVPARVEGREVVLLFESELEGELLDKLAAVQSAETLADEEREEDEATADSD